MPRFFLADKGLCAVSQTNFWGLSDSRLHGAGSHGYPARLHDEVTHRWSTDSRALACWFRHRTGWELNQA
jgi:hypothetical protein